MRAWVVAVGLACSAVGGCIASGEGPAPDPTVAVTEAIPVVERDVEGLPGVRDADLTFVDDFSRGQNIEGSVEISDGADPAAVLDEVYATLWTFQGFEPTAISVVAQLDGEEVATAEDLGATADTLFQVQLRERYGPWPGLGPTRARG